MKKTRIEILASIVLLAFAVSLEGANLPPETVHDNYTTNKDTLLIVAAPGVLGNDSDPDGDTLTAIQADDPDNGTLTLNADGSFSYQPYVGFLGTDDFFYIAYDGKTGYESATVTITVVETTTTTVDIDIKPGSDPNPINPGSNGLVPVAILSSDDFNATTVDPDSVMLAGASVAVRGKVSKSMVHEEDVNGDGLVDLVVQVETTGFDDLGAGGTVELTGTTFGGEDIVGYDEVVIVPLDK